MPIWPPHGRFHSRIQPVARSLGAGLSTRCLSTPPVITGMLSTCPTGNAGICNGYPTDSCTSMRRTRISFYLFISTETVIVYKMGLYLIGLDSIAAVFSVGDPSPTVTVVIEKPPLPTNPVMHPQYCIASHKCACFVCFTRGRPCNRRNRIPLVNFNFVMLSRTLCTRNILSLGQRLKASSHSRSHSFFCHDIFSLYNEIYHTVASLYNGNGLRGARQESDIGGGLWKRSEGGAFGGSF